MRVQYGCMAEFSTKPVIHLPLAVVYVLQQLSQAGYEGYVVGGAVRDILRQQADPSLEVVDFDFTTDATPKEILQIFPEGVYENTFGTVIIGEEHLRTQFKLPPRPTRPPTQSSNRIIAIAKATKIHVSLQQQLEKIAQEELQEAQVVPPYQITTFRSDGIYTDHRRPETVQWGTSITEDLARRDFTINALAIMLQASAFSDLGHGDAVELHPDDYRIIDNYNGVRDLLQGVIATVGDPTQRFDEDALRMLRAIRFAVQLNFAIDPATLAAIKPLSGHLELISGERIRDEFLKMLASPQPKRAIELMDETGLLAHVVPELLEGKGVEQGGHHTTDVWTHTLDATQTCPSTDPIVRLATLLHDIAKPRTKKVANGHITFYNHEIVGSRMARDIGRRLKLSRKDIDRLFILVRHHMFHYLPHNTDAAVRRFMREVGLENIDDILDLREGDRLGSHANKTSWRLEEFKQRMIEQLHQPMAVTDLAVNGNDIMIGLGLTPGPILGMLLQKLLEKVLENPSLNEKTTLLTLAEEIWESQKNS